MLGLPDEAVGAVIAELFLGGTGATLASGPGLTLFEVPVPSLPLKA